MNGKIILLSNAWREIHSPDGACLRYIGSLVSKTGENLISSITDNPWPNESVTGSYSYVLTEPERNKLTLANDVIGVYPLYYGLLGEKLIISDSLVGIADRADAELDPAGVAEAQYLPEGINLGKRTLLAGINRLLPGEKIEILFTHGKLTTKSRFDNRLFNDVKQCDAIALWNAIQAEFEVQLRNFPHVNIALSGGLDSRLVLGSIPDQKRISCYTYGDENFYEVKLAKALATIANAQFHSTWSYRALWPDKQEIINHQAQIDGHCIPVWYSMLPLLRELDGPFLLGDMCEALPGRNIKRFTSRRARRKTFFTNEILQNNYPFTKASAQTFQSWKRAKWREIQTILPHNLSRDILESVNSDFDELTARIQAHSMPYSELYEELWQWYTHSRLGTNAGKQILFPLNYTQSFAPYQSTDLLILCSNIDPNQRLGYKIIDQLFRKIEALKPFYSVPTAQAPWFPADSPRILKLLIWGLRSMIDQRLIKKAINKQKTRARRRLVSTIDWLTVYRQENMKIQLEEYFSRDELNIREQVMNLAYARKQMEKWPLSNSDIVTVSGVNLLINRLRNKY